MEARASRSVSSVLLMLLSIAFYGLAIALVLAVCLAASGAQIAVQIGPDGSPNLVAGARVQMAIPVSFTLDRAEVRTTDPAVTSDDVRIDHVQGSLQFATHDTSVPATTAVVLMLGLGLWTLGQLRALFRTLREGQPFVRANATRVRQIAYALMLGEVTRAAVVFWGNRYAATHFSAEGLTFNARPHLDVWALISGLVIMAIAEVFRAGTRLDEDQSLTV